jgi:hypothetical protein
VETPVDDLSASSGPVETSVDWVCLPQVGQWRLLWIVVMCLMWANGDSCGLGLSASSWPVETHVDWGNVPQVVQWRLLCSSASSGPVETSVDWVYLL